MSKREIQHLEKQREGEDALKRIRAVYHSALSVSTISNHTIYF